MISALFIAPQGFAQIVHVAEPGNTFKPTVFGTGLGVYDHQDIASEPLGEFTMTLVGVVVGSAIQVETQAGATLANTVAASTNVAITVPAYGPGSALNNLRIKVRKGSAAPKYLPFTTLATAFVGAASVFVAQVPDLIA